MTTVTTNAIPIQPRMMPDVASPEPVWLPAESLICLPARTEEQGQHGPEPGEPQHCPQDVSDREAVDLAGGASGLAGGWVGGSREDFLRRPETFQRVTHGRLVARRSPAQRLLKV